MNPPSVRLLRVSASAESSPRIHPQHHRFTDDDIARRQPSRHSDRPHPPAASSSARRNSKIPTLVRQSTAAKTRDTAADGTHGRVTGCDLRRSLSAGRSYETATTMDVAPSRIPRAALLLSGTPNSLAATDSNASTPRGNDKSTQSSPSLSELSLSPNLSPRHKAKKTQRKSPSGKVVSGKSQPSPSDVSSTTKTNETPKGNECSSVVPLPREEQEQSLADLIVQAFASAPLRSRKSPKSKAATTEPPGTNAAKTAKRTKRSETIPSPQLDQTDDARETLPYLPVDNMPPPHSAASAVQESGKIKISRQSPSPASRAHGPVTKTKRHPSTTTTTPTMSEPVQMNQSLRRNTDDPLSAYANASRQLSDRSTATDGPLAKNSIFTPATRYASQSSKISKSSPMSRKAGLTAVVNRHQKPQSAANRSSTPAKAKSSAKAGKSSPKCLSTATGAAADDRRRSQPPASTPADDGGTKQSLNVVDDDESPRDAADDRVNSYETGSRRNTFGGIASSRVGAGGTSTLPTDRQHGDDDDDDDEAAMIADMVDKLRQRLDTSDVSQLTSQRDDARQTANGGVLLSSDMFAAFPNAAAADISHVDTDAEDITKETFPLIEPFQPRKRKSRRSISSSRGRPAAPARDLTWTADSDTTLDEYSGEFTSGAIGHPHSPQRDLTWIEDDRVGRLPEYSDTFHDNDTRPPRTPVRDFTWIEDGVITSAEYGDEIGDGATSLIGQRTGVFDHERLKPGTSRAAGDERRTKRPFSGAKIESQREQLLRRRSVENDTVQAARPLHRGRTSHSGTTDNLLLYSDRSPTRLFTSPPPLFAAPSQRYSAPSVLWNTEPGDPSSVLSNTETDSDDDKFRPLEDRTVEQSAEFAAREMHTLWTEIADGYTSLLSRCHSFASDATIARRLTELRRQTASLMDAQRRFDGVVDPNIIHRVDALRRRADWRRRQEVSAASEPERREWMVRRAESELSLAGQFAAAFKQYSDDIAGGKAHDPRSYDTGATCTTIGTTIVVLQQHN